MAEVTVKLNKDSVKVDTVIIDEVPQERLFLSISFPDYPQLGVHEISAGYPATKQIVLAEITSLVATLKAKVDKEQAIKDLFVSEEIEVNV